MDFGVTGTSGLSFFFIRATVPRDLDHDSSRWIYGEMSQDDSIIIAKGAGWGICNLTAAVFHNY